MTVVEGWAQRLAAFGGQGALQAVLDVEDPRAASDEDMLGMEVVA